MLEGDRGLDRNELFNGRQQVKKFSGHLYKKKVALNKSLATARKRINAKS